MNKYINFEIFDYINKIETLFLETKNFIKLKKLITNINKNIFIKISNLYKNFKK